MIVQLHALSRALTPALESLHQDAFYSEPRFHTSIAWALLRSQAADPEKTHDATLDSEFPAIPAFPDSLIPTLFKEFKDSILTASIFDVTDLSVKIGKEVFTFPLMH